MFIFLLSEKRGAGECSFFSPEKNEPPMGYIMQRLYKDDFSPSQQSTSRSCDRVLQAKTVALHFVCEGQGIAISPTPPDSPDLINALLYGFIIAIPSHFMLNTASPPSALQWIGGNNGFVRTSNLSPTKVNFSNQNRRFLLRSFEGAISSVALACKDDVVSSKPIIHL